MASVAAARPADVSVRPHLRGWSHVLAGVVAAAVCPLVIVFSPQQRASVALFAGAVVGLFVISGAYHCVFWGTRAQGVFRRLDHAMIFVTIAATYTPIAMYSLSSSARVAVLWVVWMGAAGGAISRIAWPDAPRWLVVTMYVVVGWVVLPVIHQVWRSLGAAGFALLLVGGLLHSLGAVVYARRRPDPFPRWFGYHEVFHLLVVAAVAAHYTVVAFVATN